MERERLLQHRYSELQEKVRTLQEYELQIQQQREVEMNQSQLEATSTTIPAPDESYAVAEYSSGVVQQQNDQGEEVV